jgi:hypothetical protein
MALQNRSVAAQIVYLALVFGVLTKLLAWLG